MWLKSLSPFTHLGDRNSNSGLDGAGQLKGSGGWETGGSLFHSCARNHQQNMEQSNCMVNFPNVSSPVSSNVENARICRSPSLHGRNQALLTGAWLHGAMLHTICLQEPNS